LVSEEAADLNRELGTGVNELEKDLILNPTALPCTAEVLRVSLEIRPSWLNQDHPNEKDCEGGRKNEITKCILDGSKIVPTEELNGREGTDDHNSRSQDVLTCDDGPTYLVEPSEKELKGSVGFGHGQRVAELPKSCSSLCCPKSSSQGVLFLKPASGPSLQRTVKLTSSVAS
jgi:hypothetical protein